MSGKENLVEQLPGTHQGDRSALMPGYEQVLGGIVGVVEQARAGATRSVNAITTASYWSIGHMIVEQELGGQDRAGYGQELMARLAVDLTAKYGRGFGQRNLYQMCQFRLAWPPEEILQTASAKSAPTQIEQAPSTQSQSPDPTPIQTTDLSALARAFPLPWSAAVRAFTPGTSVL